MTMCLFMLIKCVQVEWKDPNEPERGFHYLYLTDKDYKAICKRAEAPWLKAQPVTACGQALLPSATVALWSCCNIPAIMKYCTYGADSV